MEKEMSGEYKQFKVYFFNDLEVADNEKEKSILKELNHLAKALFDFSRNELKLSKYACSLNINLVGDDQIQQINKDYRKKNRVTDVLSFPLQENVRKGEYDNFLEEIEFGDIFVCDSVCETQAKEFSISYIEEFLHLAVHGFLHLSGFDHEISDAEEKIMESFEEKILLEIKEARN